MVCKIILMDVVENPRRKKAMLRGAGGEWGGR